MQKTKTQKGITLIALVITVIVMMILVAVSVTVALNGGLFTTAKKATADTEVERDKELALDDGQIEVDGKEYASYEDYINKKPILPYKTSIEGLADGVTLIPYDSLETETSKEIKEGVDAGRIVAVLKETINGTETIAVVPKGFEIINGIEGTKSISEGLVIQDEEGNEFVWIPVTTDFGATYTSGDCSEPKFLKYNYSTTNASYDSQTTIDYFYGTKEDRSSYYTIDINSAGTNDLATNTTTSNGTTFDYGYHYNEMVTSVNKYDGFYIGRYETTINENKIGSKEGATILSAYEPIPQTNNQPCRWWGLYATQRNSNVAGNGTAVQTNMIWGQQWDAMITFFDKQNKDYSETSVSRIVTSQKENAGQAKYFYNSKITSDEICNIYDLRGNVYDWTAEAERTSIRIYRGRFLWRLFFSGWS